MPTRFIFAFVVLLAGALACDSSEPSREFLQCDPAATTTQLASKYDDDDHDGNPYDEDFPLVDDEDDDIADHAWIQDRDGVYHLFFHSENLYHPNQIEHYTTTDFTRIHYEGVALTVNAGAWDGDALWAPHVVQFDGTYYMFYTGVSGSGVDAVQRIGVATSKNLRTWKRLSVNRCPGTTGDGCIYDCDEPWTTWGNVGGSYDHQCRDPFVMWDAENQRWLLFATAKSTNGFGVVTVASANELSTWSGEGFIDATRRLAGGVGAQATGGQAENPFVVTSGGRHYLLFTDWEDAEDSLTVANPRTIVQFATAQLMDVDSLGSAGWIYRGYTPDPGVNAIEVIDLRHDGTRWIMSQSISNPRSGVLKPHRRELRLKCATFAAGDITTTNWGPVLDAARVTAPR